MITTIFLKLMNKLPFIELTKQYSNVFKKKHIFVQSARTLVTGKFVQFSGRASNQPILHKIYINYLFVCLIVE